jgi:lysophospholipase L1-like esterase
MLRRFSFAVCVCLALVGLGRAQGLVEHYHQRLAAFRTQNATLQAGRQHVVLVGDSLTEGWELGGRTAKYLPSLAPRVLNRGIAGDGLGLGSSRGIRHRLDASVFDCNPSHVVLLAGVNDVGRDGSGVKRSATHYETVVRAIRERLPQIPIVLVTLAPARGNYAALNPHIQAYNAHVQRIAAEHGAALLDLHPLLADDEGELKAAWTGDGLHWKNAGYQVLGRELERLLAEGGGGITDRLPR